MKAIKLRPFIPSGADYTLAQHFLKHSDSRRYIRIMDSVCFE